MRGGAGVPLEGGPRDHDALLETIGAARVVLLGEASHGTHEFYRERARITQRLIREKGFSAVAVEADWPDAYRVNRFVRGEGSDVTATEALERFRRFPTWMWRNADVLDFVGWLRPRRGARRFHDLRGTVTAASDWGAPAERKRVRTALPGSYETLLHDAGVRRFFLPLRDAGPHAEALREPRLERAIGVIYRPETERASHYFFARLSDQFDAVIHFDQSRAVEPLERTAGWERGEVPETFPSGV